MALALAFYFASFFRGKLIRPGFKSRALIPVALPRASSSSKAALCNKWVRRGPAPHPAAAQS